MSNHNLNFSLWCLSKIFTRWCLQCLLTRSVSWVYNAVCVLRAPSRVPHDTSAVVEFVGVPEMFHWGTLSCEAVTVPTVSNRIPVPPPPSPKPPYHEDGEKVPRLGRVGHRWLQVESLYTVCCCNILYNGSIWVDITFVVSVSYGNWPPGLCHFAIIQCWALFRSSLHQCSMHVNDVFPCALLLKLIPCRFNKFMHGKPQARDLFLKHAAIYLFFSSRLLSHLITKCPFTHSVGEKLIVCLVANTPNTAVAM